MNKPMLDLLAVEFAADSADVLGWDAADIRRVITHLDGIAFLLESDYTSEQVEEEYDKVKARLRLEVEKERRDRLAAAPE